MAKIKKQNQIQNLAQFRVLVNDTDPNSQYFRITQLEDTLTGGKNAFLINGSPELDPRTEVKVELVDSEGNTVFIQPIKYYIEGNARVVSIEVYEDTPAGTATLTVLGELRNLSDGSPVPPEWDKVYNVKWQRKVTINPIASNITPIRLYGYPQLSVNEILWPVRNVVTSSLISQTAGTVTLTAAEEGGTPSVQIVGASFFSLMKGGTFYSTGTMGSYTSSITRIVSSRLADLETSLPSSSLQLTPTSYKIDYYSNASFTETAFTRSFANFNLTNLTTFSGDVQRARVFVRSAETPGDYEQIGDILLEETELTSTSSLTTSNRKVSYGNFLDQSVINAYWETGRITGSYINDASIIAAENDTQLISSVHITPIDLINTGSIVPRYYLKLIPSQSFNADHEYEFLSDVLCVKGGNIAGKVKVYLSGSAFPSDSPLGQKIGEWTSPLELIRDFKPDQQTNFRAPKTGTANLYIVYTNGDWYFSDTKIVSAEQTGFNPDEVSFQLPIAGKRYERLKFKVELFDLNNNMLHVNIESDEVFFNGGNLFLQGTDNRLSGTITVATSGSGPVIASNLSGSFIGIGGKEQIPYPISSASISAYSGPPIISFYSGSRPYSGSASGPAVGFQVVGGSAGDGSFMDWNSITGRLTIKGEILVLPGTALSASIAAASSNTTGATALQQIQDLVNGSLNGNYTFINGNTIYSPRIAGLNGYISQSFGVGNINTGDGIVLTGQGYYNAAAGFQATRPSIFIGGFNGSSGLGGQFANANTPFFVAKTTGGTGLFSLGDKLTWDGTNLSIAGSITVTGGDAASQGFVTAATASLSQSLAIADSAIKAYSDSQNTSLSGSISGSMMMNLGGQLIKPAITTAASGLYLGSTFMGYYGGSAWKTYMDNTGGFYLAGAGGGDGLTWNGTALTINGSINITGTGGNAASQTFVTSADSTLSQSLALADTAIKTYSDTQNTSLSGSISGSLITDLGGKLIKPVVTTVASGLYLGSTFMGYYGGSAWKTYMDNSGGFYLSGTGTNSLTWNGTNLAIVGSITLTGGQAQTDISNAQGTATTANTTANTVTTDVNNNVKPTIFTDSSGRIIKAPTTGTSGLFLGSTYMGYYSTAQARWNTFMSDTGQFYLRSTGTNYLTWDAGALTINGAINITGGQAQTDISSAQSTANTANSTANTANSTANAVTTDVNNNVKPTIFTDSSGRITKVPTNGTSGLFLGSTYLGFHNGSIWKTYMSNTGNFYLAGTAANGLSWDGTTLSINGNIDITGGNAATQTYVTNADTTVTSNASSDATTKANTAQSNAATDATTKANAAQSNAATDATTKSGTAQTNAQTFATGADAVLNTSLTNYMNGISGSLAGDRPINLNGVVIRGTAIPASGTGLLINSSYIGFYSGGGMQTFFGSDGSYQFKSDDNNFISGNFGGSTVLKASVFNLTATTASTIRMGYAPSFNAIGGTGIYMNSNGAVSFGNTNDNTTGGFTYDGVSQFRLRGGTAFDLINGMDGANPYTRLGFGGAGATVDNGILLMTTGNIAGLTTKFSARGQYGSLVFDSANSSGGAVNITGGLYVSGDITAINSINVSSNVSVAGTVAGAAVNSSGNMTATGTVYGGGLYSYGNITANGTVSAAEFYVGGNRAAKIAYIGSVTPASQGNPTPAGGIGSLWLRY